LTQYLWSSKGRQKNDLNYALVANFEASPTHTSSPRFVVKAETDALKQNESDYCEESLQHFNQSSIFEELQRFGNGNFLTRGSQTG